MIEQMRALPAGRAMWEGGGSIDAYGSSLAMMMLPYFTHGHTTSMEGLYYESSGTTPYHFMAVSTLEGPGNASNPVRGLDYRDISDFDLGVEYLRMLGVRYYLAYSSAGAAKADANTGLRKVATVPDTDGKPPQGWAIYEVADVPLVQPLPASPSSRRASTVAPSRSASATRAHGRGAATPTTRRSRRGSASPPCGGTPPTRSTARWPPTVRRRGPGVPAGRAAQASARRSPR